MFLQIFGDRLNLFLACLSSFGIFLGDGIDNGVVDRLGDFACTFKLFDNLTFHLDDPSPSVFLMDLALWPEKKVSRRSDPGQTSTDDSKHGNIRHLLLLLHSKKIMDYIFLSTCFSRLNSMTRVVHFCDLAK